MIFGMPTLSFLVFLSWPVTYIVGAIIAYIIMGRNDEKEEIFEQKYIEYMKQIKTELPEGDDSE